MQNSIVPPRPDPFITKCWTISVRTGHVWPEMAENGWQTLPLLCGAFGNVRYWHLADIDLCTAHVCFLTQSGHRGGGEVQGVAVPLVELRLILRSNDFLKGHQHVIRVARERGYVYSLRCKHQVDRSSASSA